MILFFETHSVFQTLFLVGAIKKAREIYFFEKIYPKNNKGFFYSRIKVAVERLIRLINSDIKIVSTADIDWTDYNWLMNEKAVEFTDSFDQLIKKSCCYRAVYILLKDHAILKFFKHNVVKDVAARLYFLCLAKKMVENSEKRKRLLLIPADNNNFFILKRLFGDEEILAYFPQGLKYVNRLRLSLIKLLFIALLAFSPMIFLFRRLRLIRIGKINKKLCELNVPVVQGVGNFDGLNPQLRTKMSYDDTYLYSDEITFGRIIHIFGKWSRSAMLEKTTKEYFELSNIPYADTRKYRINGYFLLHIFKIQFYLILMFLRNFFFLSDEYFLLFYSTICILSLLRKELELSNVDYKVELIKNDYNPNHVIDTIVNNRHGKKTVGTQHAGIVHQSPELSYVHVNKYIVYGDLFVRKYPHWELLNLEKTGRENIDLTVKPSSDPETVQSLRRKLRDKYPDRKFNVLICFPSGQLLNKKTQWDEMYNGLNMVRQTKLEVNIFLRFRRLDHLDVYPHLNRFRKLTVLDRRFILEHEDFTTQELMVLSNLFIANSASFGINEAMPTAARVFTFDFIGCAKFYFPDYGSDFILYSSDDILRVFKGLENNFSGFDCDWERLREDCNYHADGKNIERIRRVILQTIEETTIGDSANKQ